MKEFSRSRRSGRTERSARISFTSPELLWKVLTAKRWEAVKVEFLLQAA